MKKLLDWFYKLLGVEQDEEEEGIEEEIKVEPVSKKQQGRFAKQAPDFKAVIVVSLTPKVKEDARRAVNFLKENKLIIVDFAKMASRQ